MFTHRAILFVLYILCTSAAVGTSTWRVLIHTKNGDHYNALLGHTFWPPLLWCTILSAFSTPLLYAVSPPKLSEDLLVMDKDGIMRQKINTVDVEWRWTYWLRRELENFVIMGYVTLVFVYSWWI